MASTCVAYKFPSWADGPHPLAHLCLLRPLETLSHSSRRGTSTIVEARVAGRSAQQTPNAPPLPCKQPPHRYRPVMPSRSTRSGRELGSATPSGHH